MSARRSGETDPAMSSFAAVAVSVTAGMVTDPSSANAASPTTRVWPAKDRCDRARQKAGDLRAEFDVQTPRRALALQPGVAGRADVGPAIEGELGREGIQRSPTIEVELDRGETGNVDGARENAAGSLIDLEEHREALPVRNERQARGRRARLIEALGVEPQIEALGRADRAWPAPRP